MGILVGGPKAWKVRKQGEIVVAFHWVNKEPAMVLFPVHKRLGAAAYIIPIGMAHTYAKRDGYPTDQAIVKCAVAAQVMAMEPTKGVLHNILTAILDNIEDLVKMPPEPTGHTAAQGKAIGEATLFLGGNKIAQSDVLDLPASLH